MATPVTHGRDAGHVLNAAPQGHTGGPASLAGASELPVSLPASVVASSPPSTLESGHPPAAGAEELEQAATTPDTESNATASRRDERMLPPLWAHPGCRAQSFVNMPPARGEPAPRSSKPRAGATSSS